MSRTLRYDYYGALHHIMIRGNNRSNIFPDDNSKYYMIKCLEEIITKLDGFIHCFIIMINHIHLLYETANFGMSRFMHDLETKYAFYYKKKYDFVGHVYQGRYKSILIEEDERYFLAVFRYILRNIVEANILKQPEKYEFSSINSYFEPKKYDFVSDRLVKEYFSSQKEILKFVNDKNSEYEYEKNRIKNINFFGGKSFIEKRLKQAQVGDRLENREFQGNYNKNSITDYLKNKFKVNLYSFRGKQKNRDKVKIRRIAIYLLANRAHLTYREISNLLNISDGAIAQAIRKVNNDKELIAEIQKFDSNVRSERLTP